MLTPTGGLIELRHVGSGTLSLLEDIVHEGQELTAEELQALEDYKELLDKFTQSEDPDRDPAYAQAHWVEQAKLLARITAISCHGDRPHACPYKIIKANGHMAPCSSTIPWAISFCTARPALGETTVITLLYLLFSKYSTGQTN